MYTFYRQERLHAAQGVCPYAWHWSSRQAAPRDDHHMRGTGAAILPLMGGGGDKRDRIAWPEDMYLVSQCQGGLPGHEQGELLAPRRRRKEPAAAPWRHGEHDGLQRTRPIQGTESLDRDRRPGARELRTSAGAYQPRGAGIGLDEKLAEADPEGHGDTFQRPNRRGDQAVFRLGNQTRRKAALGGEGPQRHPCVEAQLSEPFAHIHRAH